MVTLRRHSLWMLACALAACSASPADHPSSCVATRDCGRGEWCVSGSCRQRGLVACTVDADCGPHGGCLEAICAGATACETGLDCGVGEACDVVTGLCGLAACGPRGECPNGGGCDGATNRCGQRRSCVRDEDCGPPNGLCDGGFCTLGCGRIGCGDGLACVAASGRCRAGAACGADAACQPPATICESGACVGGCSSGSCGQGLTCGATTGRCGSSGQGCTSDGQCGAPAAICEGRTCVAGCGANGCGAGLSCDGASGRCAPTTCGGDSGCAPPATICEAGTCIAGCLTQSCSSGWTCDPGSGRCQDGAVSDVACSAGSECAGTGGFCLRPAGSSGSGICAPQCSSTADCGPGTRCAPAREAPGLKACQGGRHLASPVGPNQPGQTCAHPDGSSAPEACASGLCVGSAGSRKPPLCVQDCSSHDDCPATACRAYLTSAAAVTMACADMIDMLLNDLDYPSACQDSTMGLLPCASRLCTYDGQFCLRPCCTSTQCGRGSFCMPMLPLSQDALVAVTTLVKGCTPLPAGTGTGGIGTACSATAATSDCATNRCLAFDASGASTAPYCSDTCCRNSDCPAGFGCGALYDAPSGYSFGVCLRQ